jgi:CRP-like cAMP-binding protein
VDYDLRQCYLFTHLDDRQFAIVEQMARATKLRDGQLYFQAGDPATHFFLVVNGQIKLTRLSLQGQEKVIEIITPGQTFAVALMFGEQPDYPVNAQAMGETELLIFESEPFKAILRDSVETCFHLLADLSQGLQAFTGSEGDMAHTQSGKS